MIKLKKKSNKLLRLFLIFAAIFAAGFFTWRSDFFTIKKINVKNNNANCVDENQIKIDSNALGQNFFLIDERTIEGNLKDKFICIKKIHFLNFFPNKINLEIFGREPQAIFLKLKDNQASMSASLENIASPSAQESQDRYFVDNEAIIFAKNLGQPALQNVYLYDLDLVIGKKVNRDILKILEKVKIFGVSIQSALIIDNFLIIYPNQLPKIIFSLNSNVDTQIASLQLILEKAKIYSSQLEFVDLRFDKPIVRIAPKKS